jgi:hypothetical protein
MKKTKTIKYAEKKKVGRPFEWVPKDVADALFVWIDERYTVCEYSVEVAENGRTIPKMSGEIPYLNAFCYEHKNPVSGRPLGQHIYELAKNCPELMEAIDACRCARSSKIDAGAMLGAINSHYAAAAQRQNDAGRFVDKQDININAKINERPDIEKLRGIDPLKISQIIDSAFLDE